MARWLAALVSGSILNALTPFAAQAQAQAPGAGLPDGPGKEMVQGACTGCHQTSEILRSSGYTREGWKELTSTMIDLSASPAEREQLVEYLTMHFPPNNKRKPKLMPGQAHVTFKEWVTPTSANARATRCRRRTA